MWKESDKVCPGKQVNQFLLNICRGAGHEIGEDGNDPHMANIIPCTRCNMLLVWRELSEL